MLEPPQHFLDFGFGQSALTSAPALTQANREALDAWIAKQNQRLTRPEAIRAMMETILHILSKDPGELPAKKAKIR
jgi:hypothetical protein